jgi:hypothetical protein
MQNAEHNADDVPRMEPWLWTVSASFVPAALPLVIGTAHLEWCIALATALFGTGLWMLSVQTRQEEI